MIESHKHKSKDDSEKTKSNKTTYRLARHDNREDHNKRMLEYSLLHMRFRIKTVRVARYSFHTEIFAKCPIVILLHSISLLLS